jgi:hypothetical protein
MSFFHYIKEGYLHDHWLGLLAGLFGRAVLLPSQPEVLGLVFIV